MKRITLVALSLFSVIIIWFGLVSNPVLSQQQLDSRFYNLQADFNRLQSRMSQIESQLGQRGRLPSPAPVTPSSSRSRRNLSSQERDQMFDRLATLVIELKQQVNQLESRVKKIEKKMTSINKPVTYEGGCHCGAVRFRVVVDKHKADDCNCSICRKKGFLHLIVPQDKFILLQGEDGLTSYTFNTGIAQHKFCRICGIHSFYVPRSHPDCIDVNVRCLDGDVISQFEIVPFDGANWEQNIHKLIT